MSTNNIYFKIGIMFSQRHAKRISDKLPLFSGMKVLNYIYIILLIILHIIYI